MFIPQIEKTSVLLFLTIFSISMAYYASNQIIYDKQLGYEEKIKSTKIMEEALSILKKEVKSKLNEKNDEDIDPNNTHLIFYRTSSPMVTFYGDLKSKQTVLKPNFAALMVDLFMEAGLKKDDTIAVSMTGSMPGANIALYAACKAMDITPIVISSVGASQYGATDEYFLWPTMETILYDEKIISHKSVNGSVGGHNDSCEKRKLKGDYYGGLDCEDRAKQNLTDNGLSLLEGWEDRKKEYENVIKLKEYKAYVNIGGSQASMGAKGNRLLDKKAGLISSEYVKEKELNPGMALEFANEDVMLINIQNIPELIKNEKGEILIEFGGKKRKSNEGLLFYSERYSTFSIFFALFSTLGLVSIVGIKSYREINKHMNSYEVDSIL